MVKWIRGWFLGFEGGSFPQLCLGRFSFRFQEARDEARAIRDADDSVAVEDFGAVELFNLFVQIIRANGDDQRVPAVAWLEAYHRQRHSLAAKSLRDLLDHIIFLVVVDVGQISNKQFNLDPREEKKVSRGARNKERIQGEGELGCLKPCSDAPAVLGRKPTVQSRDAHVLQGEAKGQAQKMGGTREA